MTDGKAQRPEGSAEAPLGRSEHIPTPEGRGGEELKSCPFCGSPAGEAKWPGYVGCLDPDCGAYKANLAVAAWNRRSPLLSSPRVEEVRRKTILDAIFAVDQRLGNAWPQSEWDHDDHVREEARDHAINALRALSPPVG